MRVPAIYLYPWPIFRSLPCSVIISYVAGIRTGYQPSVLSELGFKSPAAHNVRRAQAAEKLLGENSSPELSGTQARGAGQFQRSRDKRS